MYVIHRHWTAGRKNILRKLFFAREKLGERVIAWIMFLLLLLAALCTLANANDIHVLTIFLNSPAIFFAVVNILRIWGDFKCLCLSGLFLQKQLRTVFWQQEAYKNLEKKNKHLKLKSYKRNAPLLPYPKSAKWSWITPRKDHLPTENHPSVHTERMLSWPRAWLLRRNVWEHFSYAWLPCHFWTLLWVVDWNWLICSKLLVALFCLLKFNNKENVGHFKALADNCF